MVFPFLYVFDVVKDSIQLIILTVAVGGPMLIFNNWISFTSVVSWLNNSIQFICNMNQSAIQILFQVIWCTLFAIVVPILIACSIKDGGDKGIAYILLDYLTGFFQPIQLHYKLVAASFIRETITKQKNLTLASSYAEICARIKMLEQDLKKHNQVQLGFETIYQLIGTSILICYANSETKTRQGLTALFEEQNHDILGFTLTSEVAITILLALNMLSFSKAHFTGVIAGYASNYNSVGKFMILLCITLNSIVRVGSITLYFSPVLGLFNLLIHYQGM